MTDREKLIALYNRLEDEGLVCIAGKADMADLMIANGVRLESKQATSDKTSDENKRWIPVTERLPDKWRETDEEYFGEPIEFIVHICGAKCATTLCFDGTEFFDMTMGEIYPVSHWMPLPPAPKEVK